MELDGNARRPVGLNRPPQGRSFGGRRFQNGPGRSQPEVPGLETRRVAARLVDGRVYANHYIFLFHFSGEAIREVREYSDSAHVNATFDLGD